MAVSTILSTKGQVILPVAIRNARGWRPGTSLIVEDTVEGVLLRAAPLFAVAEPSAVYGSLNDGGPPLALEDMDAAVAREARRRDAGD